MRHWGILFVPGKHLQSGTALCFLLYCVNFAICGWILNLLARQVFGAPEDQMLIAIGVLAIAWVIGFVTLVSPDGIGVREAVLLAGLTPAYGAGTALGVAIHYRLVTLLGDGLGFLIGFIAKKRLDRSRCRRGDRLDRAADERASGLNLVPPNCRELVLGGRPVAMRRSAQISGYLPSSMNPLHDRRRLIASVPRPCKGQQ